MIVKPPRHHVPFGNYGERRHRILLPLPCPERSLSADGVHHLHIEIGEVAQFLQRLVFCDTQSALLACDCVDELLGRKNRAHTVKAVKLQSVFGAT